VTRFIHAYFERTISYSTLRFIAELTLLPLPFKFVLGLLYGTFLGLMGRPYENRDLAPDLFHSGVYTFAWFVAPWYETLIFQFLVIWLLSCARASKTIIILISTGVYAAVHYPNGIVSVLSVLPLGVVLAWSFLSLHRRSLWKAYWITSTIHFLHNAASFALHVGILWIQR
jgi:hypothetical protein